MSITNEKAFEEAIEQSLIDHGGYVKGDSANFDRLICIDKVELFKFIKITQKDAWDALAGIHGAEVEKKFLYRLNQELETRGMLDCLRYGITDYGKKFSLAYFKPVSGLNPTTQKLYDQKPFRAGVEVGLATTLSNKEIYGPALFRAYELESGVAQYPRIVIGDQLINFLINLSKRNPQLENQEKEDIEWCKIIADNCLKMIVTDTDGIPILNYLGQEAIKGVSEEVKATLIKKSYQDSLKFVEDEYGKWKGLKNQKMAQRYDMLRRYVKSHPQE